MISPEMVKLLAFVLAALGAGAAVAILYLAALQYFG